MSDIDRPRSAGELIRDMFALFARDWRTHLAIGCVVVVPVYLAVFGLGLGELSARFDGSPTQSREFLEGGVLFAIVLPLVMVMVARVLTTGATAGQAIQGGLERFAIALVVAVAAIVFSMAGLFVLILPGIYLAIRLALAVPAVALENLRPLDALRRSWTLSTSPHLWRVLGLMLLVLLLTGLLEAVIEVPLASLAKAVDRQGIALAGNVISYAITLPIAAIGAALVFFDLRARQPA